ncbi:MAG: hypothetical protein AAB074_12555 [Planctomycetota bacterium]
MRTTTSTLFVLLALTSVAVARDARSPDGAWAMTVPDDWEPAKKEAYEKAPKNVHAIFASPQDESKLRSLLQVSVIEAPLFVSKEGREEFRTQCDAEIKSSEAAEAGVQIGIERVEMERIGDRDVYRMEGFQVAKDRPAVKFVKWYVPAGDKRYVFSFSSGAQTFPYKVVEFEQMSRSIWIREPVPVKPGAATDWSMVVTIAGVAVAVICGIAFVIVLRTQFKRAAPVEKQA